MRYIICESCGGQRVVSCSGLVAPCACGESWDSVSTITLDTEQERSVVRDERPVVMIASNDESDYLLSMLKDGELHRAEDALDAIDHLTVRMSWRALAVLLVLSGVMWVAIFELIMKIVG